MEKRLFSGNFRLGILGGGQLGKMILQETRRYDIFTRVLEPSHEAPCRIGSNEFIQNKITDFDQVYEFGQHCDLITIEIENVNVDALEALEHQGKKVYPQPHVLKTIKNKADQKQFYQNQNLPTARFAKVASRSECEQIINEGTLELPLVWKAATGGYDGKGVQILRKQEDLNLLPEKEEGLLERLVDFKKEIGVVVARSENGEVRAFPPVEMDFHPTANLVEYVFSPSLLFESIQQKARELACAVAGKFEIVGLLAVEMFLDQNDELLINEVAPRVHNSGHLTIEGNATSQFDQHLRAILGLPLGDSSLVRPAVMVNLIGDPDHQGPVVYEGLQQCLKIPGVYPHIYGKAETRPYRKMGHVTVTAETLEDAREKAREVKERVKVISL